MLENSTKSDDDLCKIAVAPYAGAWIETEAEEAWELPEEVAPYAGAWIETGSGTPERSGTKSLPTRERGLKPLSKISTR